MAAKLKLYAQVCRHRLGKKKIVNGTIAGENEEFKHVQYT